MDFVGDIIKEARKNPKRILFPEGTEPRIINAADYLLKNKICIPLLLKKGSIKERLKQAEQYLEQGKVDGIVTGATHSSADTARLSFKFIDSKIGRVSSYFLMILPDKRIFLFADCSININPDPNQLAKIAYTTAQTAKMFGLPQRIAMLSFSTKGSSKNDYTNKVVKATDIAKKKYKLKIIDGELQLDAAIVPQIAKIKHAYSILKGNANILIFPNLDAANIGYKLVERFAHAKALGPIIQGTSKPINDLSRGCSVEDIIGVAAITVIQAKKEVKCMF